MVELSLYKMHLTPYSENFTSSPLSNNANVEVNHRQPRTFSSPSLITLLIAATLLAKATAKSQYTSYSGYPGWVPHKTSSYNIPYYHNHYPGHYHQQPTDNPHHHHHHQLHAPPVNQQQIVNIHERPLKPHGSGSGSGAENFEDINEMNHQHIITTIQRPLDSIAEEMLASNRIYSILLPDKNFVKPNITDNSSEAYDDAAESESTEPPTIPITPLGAKHSERTTIDTLSVEASPIGVKFLEEISSNNNKKGHVKEGNSSSEELVGEKELIEKEVAETNVNYRRVRPDLIYAKTSHRRTTSKPTRKYSDSNRRRTSSPKRGHKRPFTTTYSTYFDDYEDFQPTTQRPRSRKRTTQKRYNKRRPATTTFLYDEYDYENSLESTTRINNRGPNRIRGRPTKNHNRRRPIEDSTDSQYYSMEDSADYKDDDYSGYDDIDLIPRQGTTTSTTTETTTSETTTQSSTTTTTESTTSQTTQSTPSTGSSGGTNPTSATQSPKPISGGPGEYNGTHGYGYGPGSGNDNISITYGPPGPPGGYGNYDYNNPSGAGYGPSQGNENISITYGPPTIQQRLDYVAPLLDAWYAQYSAKNAVVRRIQELLHQNTQQQPQADQYGNYNDNVY